MSTDVPAGPCLARRRLSGVGRPPPRELRTTHGEPLHWETQGVPVRPATIALGSVTTCAPGRTTSPGDVSGHPVRHRSTFLDALAHVHQSTQSETHERERACFSDRESASTTAPRLNRRTNPQRSPSNSTTLNAIASDGTHRECVRRNHDDGDAVPSRKPAVDATCSPTTRRGGARGRRPSLLSRRREGGTSHPRVRGARPQACARWWASRRPPKADRPAGSESSTAGTRPRMCASR